MCPSHRISFIWKGCTPLTTVICSIRLPVTWFPINLYITFRKRVLRDWTYIKLDENLAIQYRCVTFRDSIHFINLKICLYKLISCPNERYRTKYCNSHENSNGSISSSLHCNILLHTTHYLYTLLPHQPRNVILFEILNVSQIIKDRPYFGTKLTLTRFGFIMVTAPK